MIRPTRIVPFAFCLVAGFAATGCRSHTPLPLPDAARAVGLGLNATPSSLVIRPGSSGRVKFLLQDALGPVPDYPLTFTISDDGSGDGTANARLSSQQGLTDGNGAAELEIIVGNLANNNIPVTFSVAATCPGSAGAQADITVTTNAYSVEIVPVPADNLAGSAAIVSTRLLFYDNSTCGALDLTNVNAAPTKTRPARFANATSPSVVFPGVAASGSHAVVGLGLDSNSLVQIDGCIDIPGTSLLESVTIRATLVMDRLFPVPQGTFQVKSDLKLAPPPAALASIQSAWRQWARCPLDPARLWIDCTLDALASNTTSDPLDCVPVPGAGGSLGALLIPRRGTVVATLDGTMANAPDTPCRGQTDDAGNTSLEKLVDDLFSGTHGQLLGAKLEALSDEIAALMGDIHIDSKMTITAGSDINSYTVKHDLLGLTFPDALTSLSFATPILGLPVTSVSGIPATLKVNQAIQLVVPSHSFSLHLGTAARYAFEATNLKPRGAQDSASLVKAVFGLAQWRDQSTVLSGCMPACQNGLDALAAKLAGAFNKLDGKGLDFLLSVSGPVVDSDGDGRADALGPGLCSAALDTQGGSYVSYGSWTATRATTSP
jgi:hypothetical protein